LKNKLTGAIPVCLNGSNRESSLGKHLHGRSSTQLPRDVPLLLASYLTLPFRTTSVEALIPAIERGLAVTDRLGLLGASVTQHPEFETLLDYRSTQLHDHVRLSIASVRTNTVTVQLAQTCKAETRDRSPLP